MKSETDHLDLERVLGILRRRWWVIVSLALLVAVAAFAFSKSQEKKYTATASLLFQTSALTQQASGLQGAGNSVSADPVVMATNVQLLSHQAGVAQATARVVGHGLTPGGVLSAVSISQSGTTNVATVSATTASPLTARAIANTWATQFIAIQQRQQQTAVAQALRLVEKQISALSRQQLAGQNGQGLVDRAESLRILGRLQNGGAQIVTRAKKPSGPSSPKVARSTALGLLLGLLLGLCVAFLLERLDRRMKNVDDLEAAYGLPVLAAVPRSRSYALPPRADAVDHAGDSEVFKLLRAYLRYFNVDRELRTLLIASAAPGDGKSTIARNLAEAAQETGTKTLLVEADLRRPGLAKHYGLPIGPGLSELLSGTVAVHEAIRSIPIATRVNGATSEVALDLLVAGHPPPNPAELVESNAMAEVLSWAAEHYELVVVDTPPIGVVSDAISLLHKVDGVLVVSQLGKNTRDAAEFLRKRLVGVNAPLLGVVANGLRAKGQAAYGYGYGYAYTADKDATEPEDALTGS
jgi:capsular exopolysaccharide synthesis family protein